MVNLSINPQNVDFIKKDHISRLSPMEGTKLLGC